MAPSLMQSALKDPLDSFTEAFSNMNKWMRHTNTSSFSSDVYKAGDKMVASVEVPGIPKEDIHIESRGNCVWISGDVKKDENLDKGHIIKQERFYGTFNQMVAFPEGIDSDSLEATYDMGILTLKAPLKGEGRKIDIK